MTTKTREWIVSWRNSGPGAIHKSRFFKTEAGAMRFAERSALDLSMYDVRVREVGVAA